MNPPSIGDALNVGWTTFQKNMMPILIAVVCAALLGIIPVIGGFLAFAGMMNVSLKALRGQTPEPADGFIGFQALVDHIVMGLLQILGLIACCIGVYVTQGIFFQGTLLIIDKGMTWSDAKDRCLDQIKPNWVAWTIFCLVVGIVGGLGAILCGIGIFFTLPIATIALAYAYEQTLGAGARRAA
jgi:hypothetical protein